MFTTVIILIVSPPNHCTSVCSLDCHVTACVSMSKSSPLTSLNDCVKVLKINNYSKGVKIPKYSLILSLCCSVPSAITAVLLNKNLNVRNCISAYHFHYIFCLSGKVFTFNMHEMIEAGM